MHQWMSRPRPSLWNWSTHTIIVCSPSRSGVQKGINLLLLSHWAWHSAERSLFKESIHSKIQPVPSAPSPFASRHKADDYQLEPALLQRTNEAPQWAAKISTVCFWKLLTSYRLLALNLNSHKWACSLHKRSIDILCGTKHLEIPSIITFYVTLWTFLFHSVCRNTMVMMGPCWAELRRELWKLLCSMFLSNHTLTARDNRGCSGWRPQGSIPTLLCSSRWQVCVSAGCCETWGARRQDVHTNMQPAVAPCAESYRGCYLTWDLH